MSEDILLKINIKYGELESNIEGNYSEVWKFTNEFLKNVKLNFSNSSKNAIISTKGKSVSNILLDLRNTSFFDDPKSSKDCFKKLKEFGKTDITSNAISMALKDLVEKGELKRIQETGKFLYTAPYVS